MSNPQAAKANNPPGASDTPAPINAKRSKVRIDPVAVQRAVSEIDDLSRSRFAELKDRLGIAEGMKITDNGHAKVVRMHGISASSTAGEHGAVTNWANAARRWLRSRGE